MSEEFGGEKEQRDLKDQRDGSDGSEEKGGDEVQRVALRRGDRIVLTPDAAAFEGGSVGRHEGMAVFVSGCIPGDTVLVEIQRKRKRHAEGRAVELITAGVNHVDPRCRYFGDCGGCKWQSLRYDQQIGWKRQHVIDAFQRIGGFSDVVVRESIGCEQEYFYRNKMEFSFGDQRWVTAEEIASGEELVRDFALGLHAPGRFDRILDVEECHLQSETSNRILNLTRAFSLERGLSIYNTRTHEGLLRNLVVRNSHATGEVMVILVTSDDADDIIEEYAAHLQGSIPEVTTLVQGINRKKAQIAFSEETRTLYGPGTITERVGGNDFTISPFSFFQTNSIQAEILYREALNAAGLTGEHVVANNSGNETVWDLYCGAGTITLAAARHAKEALGIELNEGAILDARANAVRNGVSNVEFIVGDLKDRIKALSEGDHVAPDIVITDPPRAGMHADVVATLLELAPRVISYVSCNPTTQARDCALLSERYRVEYVQPVDMFPQTYHVETAARLVIIN